MDTATATIVAAILSAVSTIIGMWLKNKVSYKTKNCIENQARMGANVYTALEYTQSLMGSDRAYVFEFHNGGHYFSGRGQQKFSTTYEIVEPGISAEGDNSQDYRASRYSSYLHQLISDGKYEGSTDEVEDEAFKALLKNKGVKSIYNVPIKTLNGKIIGILGVDYVGSKFEGCVDCEGGDVKKFMRGQARIVSGYLV
jgi:hypothetical protein